MKQEFTNAFGFVYLTVEYDAHNRWIYNNWRGLLSTEAVMQGCQGVLQMLVATGCPYILNDNREVTGSWNQANDWIERNWMPPALGAGLTHFAHILAPGLFGQTAAEAMHVRVGNQFQMHLFEDLLLAQEWLRDNQQVGR